MNNTIRKYEIDITDRQAVPLPAGAVILTAQFQGPELCLWAQVDARQFSLELRTVVIIDTGQRVEDFGLLQYLATVQQLGGTLVWHIFTERNLS